jgi:hypothetical protein
MTSRGSDTLTYDGYGRITTATVGGNTACYTYSSDGSLLRRDYKANGTSCGTPTSTTKYMLGDLFEVDGAGATTTTYVDGPAGDLAGFSGPPNTTTSVSYLYYNGHGDLAAETNTSGTRTSASLLVFTL